MTTLDVEAPADAAPPKRLSKFDRPRPPRDWRWWVGGLGKVLIATGILMFGFVAYQLWGTGIEKARAQAALENQFEELLTEAPVVEVPPIDTVPAGSVPAGTVPPDSVPPEDDAAGTETAATDAPIETVPVPDLPPIEDGDPVARIEIPRIGVNDIVVAGVDKSDLKKGPGHYPGTPLPGQLGNSAIAGHRTTYGQPFYDVDKLEPGDEIVVTTLVGRYVYRVTGQEIVSPQQSEVIATVDPDRASITLTSCHPKWTTRERIIIYADLDTEASGGPVTAPLINYGRTDAPASDDLDPTNTVAAAPDPDAAPEAGGDPGDADASEPAAADDTPTAVPAPEAVDAEIADAFSDGWFSDPGAPAQVALWGLVLAAIGALSYLLSRRFKRDWVGLAVGIVPFIVTLYFFFQNVNRLLPPSL